MIVGHVLRNALILVITIIGLQFGGLMSGSVIVESVFTRPGLGRYTITAIQSRDFPQIQESCWWLPRSTSSSIWQSMSFMQ